MHISLVKKFLRIVLLAGIGLSLLYFYMFYPTEVEYGTQSNFSNLFLLLFNHYFIFSLVFVIAMVFVVCRVFNRKFLGRAVFTFYLMFFAYFLFNIVIRTKELFPYFLFFGICIFLQFLFLTFLRSSRESD